jgi:drug/metabolite transporter (DMT)-like permease
VGDLTSGDSSATEIRRSTAATMIALSALWGSSYIFIEIALRDFSPGAVAFGRQLIAGLALSPWAFRALRTPGLRNMIPRLVALAVVMVAAPTILIATGQDSVEASLAGTLVATTPLLTAVLALRLDRSQRSQGKQAVGIGLGLCGVAFLFGLDLRGSADEALGGALILAASLGYAIGGFLLNGWFRDVPTLGLVGCTSGISAIVLLPLVLTADPVERGIELGPTIALVTLGLGGTAVGWFLYYTTIVTAGPRVAAVVQYLSPVFAVLLGVALVGNDLTFGLILGLALVLLGSRLAVDPRRPAPLA